MQLIVKQKLLPKDYLFPRKEGRPNELLDIGTAIELSISNLDCPTPRQLSGHTTILKFPCRAM